MKSFNTFLLEHILSIGLNPEHEKYREKHRNEIHDMIHHSYKKVEGGYGGLGSGSPEESRAIHADISHPNLIKATRRDGKITAVDIYKKSYGRKAIAVATNGTYQGKSDLKKHKLEDHEQKRAWGEVSGALEHLHKKIGTPSIPSDRAEKLLGKKVEILPGGTHYKRKIGNEIHTKTMVGHTKENI